MTSGKKFSFVIVAGGSGTRMGGEKKQFMLLGNRPLWQWSADTAGELYGSSIFELILVVPKGHENYISSDLLKMPLKIIQGGEERALSVLNGLNAAKYDYVLVHDAARPFATKELFVALMNSTDEDAGAVPVLPVSDALKKIDGKNISCVNRDSLYITQTPQSFHRLKLIEAVKQNPYAKDEAEAWLNSGYKLNYVEGERLNFKITWPEDMTIAKLLANEKITRTGLGYDVHRLIPERKLILGGVEIPDSPLGLLGHSDADILTHAIMDAILGAAGLPDIGNIFPASDEKYHNADSMELLSEVIVRANSEGWDIDFVDSVVQAQVPRLNKYLDAIKSSLGKFFAVNIKFKSAENIDDSGEGLSMTCWASASLRRRI